MDLARIGLLHFNFMLQKNSHYFTSSGKCPVIFLSSGAHITALRRSKKVAQKIIVSQVLTFG